MLISEKPAFDMPIARLSTIVSSLPWALQGNRIVVQNTGLITTREGCELREAFVATLAYLFGAELRDINNVWLIAYLAGRGFQEAHYDDGADRIRVLMNYTNGGPRQVKLLHTQEERQHVAHHRGERDRVQGVRRVSA